MSSPPSTPNCGPTLQPAGSRPPRPSILARLRAFRHDNRGVYAIEFALLMLPFFSMMFAFIEIAFVSYVSEGLQAAVTKASRQIMTGQAQQQNYATAANFVSALLCPTTDRIMPSIVDCSKLIVDIRTATNFSSTDLSNTFYTGSTQYCLGKPGTIVVVRVVYPLPSILPLSLYNHYIGLANNVPNNAGWKHILMGSAAFQTEPYSGAVPSC